jgi:hypothetical protein
LTGTYRFHTLDFDPHVSGPIGYVWPGGGENSYVGTPNFASNLLSPGYESPNPCRLAGEDPGQISSSQCNPAGAPSYSWYQLQGSAYAPFGAVLVGSTGDLIFALNATAGFTQCDVSIVGSGGCGGKPNTGTNNICTAASATGGMGLPRPCGWSNWMILIPPGFQVPTDASDIVTTLTNDGANIYVTKLSPYDRYAPNWIMITIQVDGAINPGYNHQFINFTRAGEWYYTRVNGVRAPLTAGKYFFKMFLMGDSDIYGVGPTLPGQGAIGQLPDMWVPPQNWPVLLVKGEIDPAIITGTIRYGGYNSTLYGQPIGEAGRVYAHMETKIDPYTGQQITQCPTMGDVSVSGCTNAVGYFNASATGHYEVEGIAPGVYTLYEQAAGFPTQVCASGVTVLKGQSLHFDCYVQPGPVIHGNVYTKHQFGDEPWMGENPACSSVVGAITSCTNPYNEYIKIEFYDAPTLSNIPVAGVNLISWSPEPCVAGGQELYFGNGHAAGCGDPRLGSEIAFPWHEYDSSNGYVRDVSESTCPVPSQSNCNISANKFGDLTSDPQGIGPPQHWLVQGGTTIPFHFEMGVKGEYGAPKDLDGMVPQVYATWVNGLTPGRYYARAWVFRYVQSALDGSTFQEYYFDVTPNEWAGDVTLPIDLRLSSWVNKTVHYHNLLGTINEDTINTGAGFLYGYLVGGDSQIYSYNVTALGYQGKYAIAPGGPDTLCGAVIPSTLCGYFYAQPRVDNENLDPGSVVPGAGVNAHAIERGRANIQFWGINDTWMGENYGIPSGTYTVATATEGYVQQSSSEQVSLTLSGSPTQVSDHLYRGVGFNVTVYSVDWERPTVNRPWVWGNDQGGLGSVSIPLGSSTPTCSTQGVTTNCNQVQRGSEIDLGFYSNNSVAGFIGDNLKHLPVTLVTTGLFQGVGGIPCPPDTALPTSPPAMSRSCTMMDGGGRNISPRDETNMSYFGREAGDQWVGGYTPGVFGWLVAQVPRPVFTSIVTWPNSFPTGMYEIRAFTFGYVQDQIFSVYAQQGEIADARINLVIGVNITVDVLLKKEHVITGASTNMSGRVRVFDDQGNLVAEWMSSEGTYTTANGFAKAADGTTNFSFISQANLTRPGSGLNSYDFIPAGTSLLHVMMGGLPQQPPVGMMITGTYFGDPVFTPNSCAFELGCYEFTYGRYLPLQNVSYPFANSGILGYPDYVGSWTAEVDFVNWYANNTGTPEPLSVCGSGEQLLPYQTPFVTLPPNAICPSSSAIFQGTSGPTGSTIFPQYYPPVQGLLLGESYHIIPGTTAKSGISLTEDAALHVFLGHGMDMNHLGPYSQEGVWQISNAHNSGEASAIFEVDLNGLVTGNAFAFTWANEFRTLSWATISVTGAPSTAGSPWNLYTLDGQYQAYLPPGTYQFTISSPGLTSQTYSVAVSSGQTGAGYNMYLEQSNLPVPEFSGLAIAAISALAASVYVLRRRRVRQRD